MPTNYILITIIFFFIKITIYDKKIKYKNEIVMTKYVPSLNGLRGISIMMVIFGHLLLRSFPLLVIPYPLSLIVNASLGVNVFFVISGFLITKLLLQEEFLNGIINLKSFFIRRAFRIFPAYYFILLVYFILQLFAVLHFSMQSWLSSIFYYKYISNGAYVDWESGHFWSLSVEEHFYLVWPLIFVTFKQQRVLFSIFIILAVIFFRLNSYYHYLPTTFFDDQLSIFQRVDAIMFGCLFALYEQQIIKIVIRYSKSFLHPLSIIIVLFLVGSNFFVQMNMSYRLHLGFIIVPFGIGTFTGTFSNLLIALLIIVSINVKGWWFGFLNLPILNYLGRLSYSLYLWQELFMSKHIGFLSSFPINIICAFCAANISYYLIEKPLLKLKSKYQSNKVVINNLSNVATF